MPLGANASHRVHKCLTEHACTGTSPAQQDPCEAGRYGIFCDSCDWPAYYRDEGECFACNVETPRILTLLPPALLLVAAFATLAYLCFIGQAARQRLGQKVTQAVGEVVDAEKHQAREGGPVNASDTDIYSTVGDVLLDDMQRTAKESLKESLNKVPLPPPLTWEDVQPVLELIDSEEELTAAIADPAAFMRRLLNEAAGPAAFKLVITRLRPMLEPRLPKPLTWDEVQPCIELIDSIEELRAAITDPATFMQTLMHEAVYPAAFKLAITRLRPVLEPRLPKPLTWDEVQPCIELIDSIEELRAAITDPAAFLQTSLSYLVEAKLSQLRDHTSGHSSPPPSPPALKVPRPAKKLTIARLTPPTTKGGLGSLRRLGSGISSSSLKLGKKMGVAAVKSKRQWGMLMQLNTRAHLPTRF